MLDRWFDGIQVRRARRAYTGVSARPAPAPGYAGMVAEMRRGLAELDEATRGRADDAVFDTIFFAPVGLAVLRAAARRWPDATARLAARAAPTTLRWLVGEVRYVAPAANHVPACAFRVAGGPDLCEHVCRRPTEAFLARQGLPIRFAPDPASQGCDWSWGAAADGRA